MPLALYGLRRAGAALVMLPAVAALVFVLVHLAPGDPAYYLAGDGGTSAYYSLIRHKFELDRPLAQQLGRYLWTMLRGDLGRSLHEGAPVLTLVLQRLPATVLLAGTALAVSSTAGIAAGMWSARRAGSAADRLMLGLTALGSAIPVFWIGLLLILIFSLDLGWFPVEGMFSPGASGGGGAVGDVLRHLVLPAAALAIPPLAAFSRLMRIKMLDALREPFILTARAKGLRSGRVARHAARAALLPVVTVIGGHASGLVTGAVLTETVFAWPGVGRLALDATLARDYPVVIGVVIIVCAGTIGLNLVADLLYAAFDPRIAYQ
jgi:peptide/nickel transport system permease protein